MEISTLVLLLMTHVEYRSLVYGGWVVNIIIILAYLPKL